jgi:thiol:disulfide interchange protein
MRQTRIGMIILGLAIWLVAIAWPGWSMPGLLLGAAMVAFATFGLLTER